MQSTSFKETANSQLTLPPLIIYYLTKVDPKKK